MKPAFCLQKRVRIYRMSFVQGTPVHRQQKTTLRALKLWDDRRWKLCDLKFLVHKIAHKKLKYKKVSFHWVPKQLTKEHMDDSFHLFKRYRDLNENFLEHMIMGDKIKGAETNVDPSSSTHIPNSKFSSQLRNWW